jgi:hypothetical protein
MPRRQALPPEWNLEIIELRGRFYPVRIGQAENGTFRFYHFYWDIEAEHGIPFASGLQPTCGVVSMGTWKLAFDFCQRHHEEFEILYKLGREAAKLEIYPERNVWYREALQALGARCPGVYGGIEGVDCCTFVGETYYFVRAWTVEDALALLYQKVYEQVHEGGSGVQKETMSA